MFSSYHQMKKKREILTNKYFLDVFHDNIKAICNLDEDSFTNLEDESHFSKIFGLELNSITEEMKNSRILNRISKEGGQPKKEEKDFKEEFNEKERKDVKEYSEFSFLLKETINSIFQLIFTENKLEPKVKDYKFEEFDFQKLIKLQSYYISSSNLLKEFFKLIDYIIKKLFSQFFEENYSNKVLLDMFTQVNCSKEDDERSEVEGEEVERRSGLGGIDIEEKLEKFNKFITRNHKKINSFFTEIINIFGLVIQSASFLDMIFKDEIELIQKYFKQKNISFQLISVKLFLQRFVINNRIIKVSKQFFNFIRN